MAAITAEQAGSVELVKFLDLLAYSEGTTYDPLTRCDGYDVIVTSIHGHEVLTDYSDHPFADGRAPYIVKQIPLVRSTAAGRYQILYRYWKVYKAQLNLPDFSPLSQDLVAIQQIRERGAISHIAKGDIQTGVMLCRNTWASLPGNNYGQGGKTLADLMQHYATLQEV
jgi:muramidase (phage lysozyme)